MSYTIAVDGPAGAGKSTIAKEIAKRLNLIYVDTGVMYRAMALHIIRNKVNYEDENEIIKVSQKDNITIRYEDEKQMVYLNNENVTALLRTEEVGNMDYVVSTWIPVREKIV